MYFRSKILPQILLARYPWQTANRKVYTQKYQSPRMIFWRELAVRTYLVNDTQKKITFMPPVPPVMSSFLIWLNTIHRTECISADTENTSWKLRLNTCKDEKMGWCQHTVVHWKTEPLVKSEGETRTPSQERSTPVTQNHQI